MSLASIKAVRLLFVINCALLFGHLFLEGDRGDLNWLRLGRRSPLSQAYMGCEGGALIALVLAVFGFYYPGKQESLLAFKLVLFAACIVGLEFAVWLFYW